MKTSKFSKIFISALIITIGALLLINNYIKSGDTTIKGLIIPHHLLAKVNIEKIYKKNASDQVDTVILISPNHFYYGYNYIQTSDENFDYEGKILEIDKKLLKRLTENSSTKIENKNFKKEHGITVHLPFILEAFPNAKLLPITFKKETPEKQLKELVENLNKNIFGKNIVIIASIDFSHYVDEKIAYETDNKIINWIKDWSKYKNSANLKEISQLAKTNTTKNVEAVAMDSPESLYVFLKFLEKNRPRNFFLFARTSTTTLTGIKKADSNTSHIFGKFY